MKCSHCQYDNPEGARFCVECGTKLEIKCQSCGTENPPTHKFCFECGHKLTESVRPAKAPKLEEPESYIPKHLAEKILGNKASLEGERKQVTVLFADVSGFTALSEKLDPEDVRALMNKCFEIIIEEVHRYEGTINQFAGDGVMALFGAPVALEDHPYRAVNAALAIQKGLKTYGEALKKESGIDLRMRIGLNTGLVVVGSIGNDLRMDYTAIGDTVNLASRLQNLADPGKILISENTQKPVSGYFLTRPLGEVQVKGKSEPIKAYEVIRASGARTRIDVEVERGLTPFTGRERELSTLKDRLRETKEGRGHIVFIVGELGVGKSRLPLEFRKALSGENVSWLEGRCISFGKSISYLPLIEILKRGFRIDESDNEEEIIRKVEEGTLLLGNDLEPIIPYLKYLLSVDPGETSILSMDAQQRRAQTFEALRKIILQGSQIQPLVLVIEDLHWIDKTSEEFLIFLADSLATAPVLLLLTYRPDYSHSLGERTYHTRIVLHNLTREESVRMAESLLENSGLPDELRDLITRKGKGNPFFIEEVIKSLLEIEALKKTENKYVLTKKISEVYIPDTIQDIIMARIDRLDENHKKTIQTASVIGREFAFRLLKKVSDLKEKLEDFLRDLKHLEIIYEKGFHPELAYMFKHVLTQEVAYNSLLLQRRKELHRLIGMAIEELYADKLEGQFEVLAHHYYLSENWEKAFEYLLRSGDKAKAAYATREALEYYDKALKVAQRLPSESDAVKNTMILIYGGRGQVFGLSAEYDRAIVDFQQMLEWSKQAGNRHQEGEALYNLGWAHWWKLTIEDIERAMNYSEQALSIAKELDDKKLLVKSLSTIALVYQARGTLDEGDRVLQESIEISRAIGYNHAMPSNLFNLGIQAHWRGDAKTAIMHGKEGLEVSKEVRDGFYTLRSMFILGLGFCEKGDYDEALSVLQDGLSLANEVRNGFHLAALPTVMGWLYRGLGDLEKALDYHHRALDTARQYKALNPEVSALIDLGVDYLLQGNISRALVYLEEVCERMEKGGFSSHKQRWKIRLCHALGETWLAQGDCGKALTFAEECINLSEKTGAQKYLAKAYKVKGDVLSTLGKLEEASFELKKALNLTNRIAYPPLGWMLNFALGRLYQAQGKSDESEVYYRRAIEAIEKLASRIGSDELRKTFLSSREVEQVYAVRG